ncbi:peptidylprolyl isomerase [Stakelama marina]|uniref:peptidylprolyl isomerase n=1 Tax=Stakelama marina TaxID=2826939 RepID=A0A8T4ICZ9_9SPHN|nr:peptidylprolyl isomerase [Stakelama marina]MBR0551972.1 peptidylprolyl isomerase [Stakelama marina]
MKHLLRGVLLLLAGLIALPALAQDKPAPDADGQVFVKLDTSAGPMTLAIETEKAPITAKNFLHYVDTKRLDGREFYRIVKVDKEFGFVQFGMDGNPKLSFPPIKHEPTTETGLHHTDGTISIARLKPGSARGEFTIVVGDNRASFDADPSKPGDNLGYAAFGHIVSGRDTLIKILDTPVDPDNAKENGAFKGQMPDDPVTIISARRVPAPAQVEGAPESAPAAPADTQTAG